MEFLRGFTTASASGLFMICSYLSSCEEPVSEAELRKELQFFQVGQSNIVKSCLAVGANLGLLSGVNEPKVWMVDSAVSTILTQEVDKWGSFRADLLRRICEHAGASIEEVSDLALGLTWFLQSNPTSPIHLSWHGFTEIPAKASTNRGSKDPAINNGEQWVAFQRWALELGVARKVDDSSCKVLIPDASTAIRDQLPFLPIESRAKGWVDSLLERLPILGHKSFRAFLPDTNYAETEALAPALSLGLLKLEKQGIIKLSGADDGEGVLVLGLSSGRQVGRIQVRSGT
jgi:hypothetical protein